jgi:hypothetical protein
MLRYFEAMATGTPAVPRGDSQPQTEAGDGPILGSRDAEARPSANERVIDTE